MEDEAPLKKSFSPWKRWGLQLDLVVRTVLVLAVVVMLNYLGSRWYHRFTINTAVRQPLSPLTINLLKSITNHVNVTLYYDKDDELFSLITALLDQYRDVNPRIHVATVDYIRNAGAAEKLKADNSPYKAYVAGTTNKNLVLFECNGKIIPVNGQALGQFLTEQVPDADQLTFRKRTMFYGETLFTAALIAVLNPKPFKVCYLIGHREHPLEDQSEEGYSSFYTELKKNHLAVEPLSLLGTNTVPADCNLLIIAGPTEPLAEPERDRIRDYLRQGGRLLAMLNCRSLERPSGVEGIVAGLGVAAGDQIISDPQNTISGADIGISEFTDRPHPVVSPLQNSALHLIQPRPVGRLLETSTSPDDPRIKGVAFTGPQAMLDRGPNRGPRNFPVIVAVEKGNVPGVVTERGTTRALIVGDSFFLNNHMINSAGNRDFLGYAVNWLLERPELMQGLGPRPVKDYQLAMTAKQLQSTRWLMLAAIPGSVLALGGLVWLRRRK